MDLVTLSMAKNYTNGQIAEVDAELSVKTNQTSIAPAYSTSSTYALSDICTYLGTRYKCTAAITTPEAWTIAHWAAESTQTVLDSHTSQLADITSTLTVENETWEVE